MHHSKIFDLVVEINQPLIESLVDINGASMSIMAMSVICGLGIMHLVIGHETYKTTFGTITQLLRRIHNKQMVLWTRWYVI
jgi:hypothetical protein